MKPIMQFENEDALQAFMHACLGGEREVKLSDACRIDLRTDDWDIEIKPFLTKPAMDKAAGQLMRYAPYAEGRQQVIAGCTPNNAGQALERQAESLREAGVEVWFVDQIPAFQEAYQTLYGAAPAAASSSEGTYFAGSYSEFLEEVEEKPTGAAAIWIVFAVFALLALFGSHTVSPETVSSEQPEIAATEPEIPEEIVEVSVPEGYELALRADNGEQIGALVTGDRVTILGPETGNGYVWVRTPAGDEGWAFKAYLMN